MSQDDLIPLRFPCGKGGLNRSKNFVDFPPTDLTMSESITTEGDTWRKEGGATKINTTSFGSAILGGFDFWPGTPAVKEIIVTLADGRVLAVASDLSTKTIATGFGTGVPVFAEGWDGDQEALYFCESSGSTQIHVYTGGASASLIPKPNTDWTSANGFPTGIVHHSARMFAYGYAKSPHDIFGSLATDHGDYASPDTFRQAATIGVGDGVVTAFSWRGKLYFGKRPVGLYILDDSGVNIPEWSIVPVTQSIGFAGATSWVELDDDILIIGPSGFFYSLGQVENQGEQSATPILPIETSDFFKEEINVARLDLSQLIWYGHKRQFMIAVPAVGATTNTRRIVGDFHSGRLQLHYSRRDNCPALFLERATITSPLTPVIGDSSGFLWRLDQSARSKDGAGYTSQFETPPLTFFDGGSRRGNLMALDLVFAQKGNYDVNVEVHRDGKLSQTLTFSQQSAGGAVGSVSLDQDVLGGITIANRRHKVGGDAVRAKLIGYNNVANQDFAIQDLILWHTPGNNRP